MVQVCSLTVKQDLTDEEIVKLKTQLDERGIGIKLFQNNVAQEIGYVEDFKDQGNKIKTQVRFQEPLGFKHHELGGFMFMPFYGVYFLVKQ